MVDRMMKRERERGGEGETEMRKILRVSLPFCDEYANDLSRFVCSNEKEEDTE